MNRFANSTNIVWIVEDHSGLRQTMKEALEASGCGCVQTFASCEASLCSLKSVTTLRPKVIILDIGLPGMSGLEGLREIKNLSPASEILMFTVSDERQHVFDAICAGASGYLLKSEPIERIVTAVQEVTQGGAPMSLEIARNVLHRLSQLIPSKPVSELSDRELEVLTLLADGLTKKEIAKHLELSLHTVDNYVRRIYTKLHVNSLGGAIAKALRDGLV
jgi:DNA-binding NarL/FixJ family response regulator